MIESILMTAVSLLITVGLGSVATIKVKNHMVEKRQERNPNVHEGALLKFVRNKGSGVDLMTNCKIISLTGKSVLIKDRAGNTVWFTNAQFDGYEFVKEADQ